MSVDHAEELLTCTGPDEQQTFLRLLFGHWVRTPLRVVASCKRLAPGEGRKGSVPV